MILASMCSGPQDFDFLVDKGKSVKIFFDLWSDKQQKKGDDKRISSRFGYFNNFFAGFFLVF